MKRITAFVLVLLLALTLLPAAAFAVASPVAFNASNLQLLDYWAARGVKECGYTASSGDISMRLLIHVPQDQKDGHFTDAVETNIKMYSQIWKGDDDGQAIVNADVTVKTVKNFTTITGTLTVEDGTVYAINLTGPTGMRYDSAYSDFNYSFTAAQTTVNNRYYRDGKSILVKATDGTHTIDLLFYVGWADPLMIPAGTYPINDSGKNGTVLASTGRVGNTVYRSYAAVGSSLWFLQDGTVTVCHRGGKLLFTVNAKNCYDRVISSTFEAKPGNYIAVYAALDVAERAINSGLYTEYSTAVLQSAVDSVQYALPASEQKTIDRMAENIGKAIGDLEYRTLYAAAVCGAEAAVRAAGGVNPSAAVRNLTNSALNEIHSANTVAAVKAAQYKWVASIGRQVAADVSARAVSTVSAFLGRLFR